MSARHVPMTPEQFKVLDEVVVPGLMRANDQRRAAEMMALALAYKFAPENKPELPSNVVEMQGFSRRVEAS